MEEKSFTRNIITIINFYDKSRYQTNQIMDTNMAKNHSSIFDLISHNALCYIDKNQLDKE